MRLPEFLSRRLRGKAEKPLDRTESSKVLPVGRDELRHDEKNNYGRSTFKEKEGGDRYHSFYRERFSVGIEELDKPEEEIIASQITARVLKIACNVADIVTSGEGEYFSVEDLSKKKVVRSEFEKKFPHKADECMADRLILSYVFHDRDHEGDQNVVYFDNGDYYFYDFERSVFFNSNLGMDYEIFLLENNERVLNQFKSKINKLKLFYESENGETTFRAILEPHKLSLDKIFFGLKPSGDQINYLYNLFMKRLSDASQVIAEIQSK